MGFKITFCFLISLVPLAVIAVAPVHPDPVEPFDLLLRQLSFRVRPLLICKPYSKPFPGRCYIGAGNIQVPVFLVIGHSQGIGLFPLGVEDAPHHTDLIQLCDAFFLQAAIQLLLPGLENPLAQGIALRVHILSSHQQISVGVMVFLCSLEPVLPCNFLPIAPNHANAVQPCDLLLGQIALDLPFTHTALGDQPHPKAQTSRRGISFRDVQVAVLRIVDARLRKIVLPTGGQTRL